MIIECTQKENIIISNSILNHYQLINVSAFVQVESALLSKNKNLLRKGVGEREWDPLGRGKEEGGNHSERLGNSYSIIRKTRGRS
jgi:hypothetical protein